MDDDPRSIWLQDAAAEEAYRVLGLQPGASWASLNAAYLRQVNRYNPNRVAPLGPEIEALAVRKLAEATAAFNTLLHSGVRRA